MRLCSFSYLDMGNICTKVCIAHRRNYKKMKEDLGWQFWTTAMLGLIGALAWLPSILEWTRKAKIEGKIISQYENVGAFSIDSAIGTIVVQKLSIFSRRKEFFNKNIKVFLKFPNRNDEVEAQVIVPRKLLFTFEENKAKVVRELDIESNEHILLFTIFPKDESVTGYIVFKLNFKIEQNYEYVRYAFNGFGDKKLELKIPSSEIKANELLHDEQIWK